MEVEASVSGANSISYSEEFSIHDIEAIILYTSLSRGGSWDDASRSSVVHHLFASSSKGIVMIADRLFLFCAGVGS